jgi:two-component system OmpR family sensor kinase
MKALVRPATLAGQLTRTLVLWVGGVWIACVAGTVWYVDREINFNFDHELVEVSHRMFDIALDTLDRSAPAEGPVVLAPPPTFDDAAVRFQIVAASGHVLMRSADTPATLFDAPLAAGFADAGKWRLYTVRHPSRLLFLQVADPLEERSTAVNRTLYGLIVLLCAVLPLLALLLWRIARAQLHSLERLSGEIALRDGLQLQPIALEGLPRELQQVCDHVNRLLERLAHALDVERALAANAAHELRTPLSAARLRLQTVIESPATHTQDTVPHVRAALQSLEALSQRAEKLLQLSRAESGRAFARDAVDLPRVAAAVAEDFWAVHGPGCLTLHVDDGDLQPTLGDADVLAIALRNLAENALRHGRGAPVQIEVMAPATLVVRDAGPGVPASQIGTLVQRHVRQSADRAGYGLGLSIVLTVVERHGAKLELLSPPPGHAQGLEARIVLPPAPH